MTGLALVLALTAPALGGGPDLTAPPLDTPVIVELRPVAPPRTPPPTPVSPVTVPSEAAFFTEIAASAVVPKPPPPPPPVVVQQPAAQADHGNAIARARSAPNGQLPREALCGLSFSSGLLRCDAAAALEQAVANGMPPVEITSTYRSLNDQRAVKASRGSWAAPVGSSVHGYGLAIDVPEPARSWLHRRGAEYGWTNPAWARPGGSKPEPWHFEHTG